MSNFILTKGCCIMLAVKSKKAVFNLGEEGIQKLAKLGSNQAEFADLVTQGLDRMPVKAVVELGNGDRHGICIQKNPEGIIYISFASLKCIVVQTDDGYTVHNIPDSFFKGYDIFDIQDIINAKRPEITLAKIKNQMGI